MVLVGDSIHAPSNSSGRGASLAVESAVEVARCLRDAPTFEQAFRTFEAIAAAAARINHTKTPRAVGPGDPAVRDARLLPALLVPGEDCCADPALSHQLGHVGRYGSSGT
jgi:2-polyprenyl-6-methoxyphenol hydroxylase-like FAD-dependent oxidoreductase